MIFVHYGQWCAQLPKSYESGHMKDLLGNGKTWLQCFVPTLYAISVLRHLDLKTHFDNHCIFSESMFVLLEKKQKRKELQGELDCLLRPFCKYLNYLSWQRHLLTSAYFVSSVGDDTNHKSSVSCNQFINWCKYDNKKSHCAPLAKYTFFTVCLSLDYVCRNGCHSFEGPFFYTSFLHYLAYLSTEWHYREKLMSETFLVLSGFNRQTNCALFATAFYYKFLYQFLLYNVLLFFYSLKAVNRYYRKLQQKSVFI